MTQKTHWKQLTNPDYIGAYSLQEGQDLTVTITKVVREMVTSTGGKKEECTVAHLQGHKPMIMNVTNCKTITNLYKTPYIEEWAGKSITIFATNTKLKGEDVECLRIRPTTPILLEDVIALFELKKGSLNEAETKRANDIIETKEVSSYPKLINILKAK